MIDAPCGGMLWQQAMLAQLKHNVHNFKFLGIDVVDSVVKSNTVMFQAWPHVKFKHYDLTSPHAIPKGYELIFSRDALQHDTLQDVWIILKNFASSDATRLLLGSYPCGSLDRNVSITAMCGGVNGQIEPGQYRPIDLAAPPFNLQPRRVYDEGVPDGKHLYLYNRLDMQKQLP